MTTIDWHLPARRHRSGNRIAWILDHLRQKARICRDMRHLSELSDEMLRDIGVRRSDIPFVVRFGRHA